MIVMLCMLSAVMVDLGYLHSCKSRMQNAADAAAIAAVMRLGNENSKDTMIEARSWAIDFANRNLPGFGDVLVADDISFGIWNPATKTFTASMNTPNAVQILVRRDGLNTESIGTFFMNIFGTADIGLTTTAIATLASASAAEGVPMALRAPDFGSVDSDISDENAGKDGPGSPANGESFEVGEQVVVYIYGKGKKSPVHLALDIEGVTNGDLTKILKGSSEAIEMQVGDEVNVLNEGTGGGGYGSALDDRLKLSVNDPGRDIVMPVVETLPGSRNGDGQLTGKVRIADFVAVHLDDVVEVDIPDPDNPSKTITVSYLMGTITNRRAETSWGGATPSGAGGGGVAIVELVY